MKAYLCNINQINEDIESFVIVKNKIESTLIENKQIEKKMTVQEFLSYNDLSKVFINDNNTIAFSIEYNQLKNEYYIVYSAIDKNTEKLFKDVLKLIEYNLNNLTKISELDFMNGKTDNKPYFIIKHEFYIY